MTMEEIDVFDLGDEKSPYTLYKRSFDGYYIFLGSDNKPVLPPKLDMAELIDDLHAAFGSGHQDPDV